MKYWYLKGGDVLGPLSAAEIVKDDDFNADAMVCPENESARQESWKAPQEYADFSAFLAKSVPVNKDAARAAALIEELSPEDTIHSRSPLTASLENNLLDDLPSKAVLSTPAQAPAPKPAPPPPAPKPAAGPAQDFTDIELEDVFTERHSEPFSEEAFTLPPLPLKTARKKPAPGGAAQNLVPEQAPETFTRKSAIVLTPQNAAPPANADNKEKNKIFSAMEEESAPAATHKEPYPIAAANTQTQKIAQNVEVSDIFSKNTLDPGKNGVKPMRKTLLVTTSNGKIINSVSEEREQTAKKKDKIFLLLVIMFIAVAASAFMFFFKQDKPLPAPPAPSAPARLAPFEEPAPATQGIAEGIAAPNVKVQPEQEVFKTPGLSQQAGNITVSAPQELTSKMMAQRMVKEYLLDVRRGTVDEYFKKSYDDYKTFWTADHLYENAYVVEFSASKVRQEPIKYLFRIDIKTRQLVGMNKITMDLLSNSTI